MSVEGIRYDSLSSVFKGAVGGIIETAGDVARSRLRGSSASTDTRQAIPVPAGTRVRQPVEGDGPATLADTVRENALLIFGGLFALAVGVLIVKKLG